MEKKTTQSPKVGESIQNEKVEISLNHIAKENETARQFALRIAREKRKATNDAGKDMAKAIKNSFLNLSVIRLMFKENARAESDIFCANLSAETGKQISVDDVYKLPIREYMDYIKETEAARNMLRGGITPTEFKNIITRYYRGEKCANVDNLTRDILTDIHGA
jgi:maltooligosyltrehalose synthase